MVDAQAKLLIVDDQEHNLVAMGEVLRGEEAELLLARSGHDALELLLKHEVALALIDVQMPRMDGYELAELMRGVERTRKVPLIFVTAAVPHELRFRGYEAGAVDFLFKPIEPEIIRSKVGVFLQLYRQRRELAAQRDELRRLLEARRHAAEELEARVRERTCDLLQSQERLRILGNELNLAELRERKRLAAELHDHLQQMLVFGKIKLNQGRQPGRDGSSSAEIMRQLDEVFTNALAYTRTLVAELSPPALRDHGLAAGLTWLGEYMKKYDLAVTVTVPEQDALTLPEEQVALLFQSVRELLLNTWKHAATDQAAVTMIQRPDHLRIEVRDHGKGFHAPTAGASADSQSSKFGLLSIRERMIALGGSFEIDSSPGAGTRSVLTLPLTFPPANHHQAPRFVQKQGRAKREKRMDHARTIRVVLVDDHAMVRQGLRSVLDGYRDLEVVAEASDGEQALDVVDRFTPAVVLMDINMPKMDGIDATARLKARHPDLHVIGLSVNAARDNQEAMLKAGAHVLITKEAAVDHIYTAIQEALQRSAHIPSLPQP